MNVRSIGYYTAIFALYGGFSGYIGWNGWIFLSEAAGWENPVFFSIVIFFLASMYIIGRIGQSTPLRFVTEPLKHVGSYWLAILQYGILILPFVNVAGLLLEWSGVSIKTYMIAVGVIVTLLLLILLALGSRNAWSPVIRRYNVHISKKAGNTRYLTIAMASDLHLGAVIGNRHLERLLRKINEIKPDIIMLPGDILDHDITPFIQKGMPAVLGRLNAPLGVYAVMGNHEYIGGKASEFAAALDGLGIRVLLDEAVVVDNSFIVIGRKDKSVASRESTGRKPIADLAAPLDQSLPIILLDHQPADLTAAERNGIDLILSGHTHKGQLAPNHWITSRIFELDWGYKQKGTLHAIVSSGFGFWGPPLRIGSRSEVLRIDVQFDTVAGSL